MSKESVLADLQKKVGTEEKVGDWIAVDQKRINLFADATDDHQWIHIDADRAKRESPYKETIAHGFLTLSLLPALSREIEGGASPFPGVKLAVNYGLNKVRFPAPVKVNSNIRSRSKLKQVEEVAGGLQLVREVIVEVQDSDKPCCIAETLTRLYF